MILHVLQDCPIFDAMLLGLGPDGHVASLFPNRSQIAATDSWVLPVENSPKPPTRAHHHVSARHQQVRLQDALLSRVPFTLKAIVE